MIGCVRPVAGVAVALLLLWCSSGSGRTGGPPAARTWGYHDCPLDREIIDSSHVVRLNATTGAVTSVEFTRTGDPRAKVFTANPIAPRAAVELTRNDGVKGFSDAGSDAVALVGQPRTDLPTKWAVHAVAVEEAGALRFVGPCAPEFTRQWAAMQAGFSSTGDLAFLGRMVNEALSPGRGADLRNMAVLQGPDASEVTDLLAPRWEGRVRTVMLSLTFTPPEAAGAAGLASGVGFFGIGRGAGVSAPVLEVVAVVPLEGPVHVQILDGGQPIGVPLDLANSNCRDAEGMQVTVDMTALTSRCQAGISADQKSRIDDAQKALQFDHSAAAPQFASGPPGQG